MQISRLWHLRLMSPVRTYLVAGLVLSGSDTGLLQPRVVVRGNQASWGEMSCMPFRPQPLTARGINASKSGWGHQVWAEGRWHTRAGAEHKGAFRRLFWRRMRRCRAPGGRAPVWVRLSFAFPAFLGSTGWCPVVCRQGSGFPGKPVSPDYWDPLAKGRVGALEIELGSLGAGNSQGSLEIIWKKKKNPPEIHLFFYTVSCCYFLKSSFYLIHDHLWRVWFTDSNVGGGSSVRAWRQQLCNHTLAQVLDFS